MTLLRIVLFVLVVGATCSAQSILPIGKNIDKHIGRVFIGIATKVGFKANGNGRGENFQYDGSAPFLEVLEQKLRSEILKPYKGEENSPHAIFVAADAKNGDYRGVGGIGPEDENDYFLLEKQGGRLVIPEESLRRALRSFRYYGASFQLTGITGFEATMRKGERIVGFSTITQENTWDNISCQIPSLLNDIIAGVIGIPRPLAISSDPERWWDEEELTFWEGENFVVVDGDGNLLRRSVKLPSFIPALPLALAIEKNGSSVEVSLTGEGAETATIEESEDLVTWGPPYSLTPLPETSVSSTRGGRHYVTTPVTQRLYRVRPPSVEPQTRN